MRSLNLTVGSKKYNADIELLSGVSQLKTYFLSQQIPSLDKLIRKELYFISDELI
jgi:hypothetical protein